MKILYIVHELHLSGASISFFNLVSGIKEKGNDILVVAPNYTSDATKVNYLFVSRLTNKCIPSIQIPLRWDVETEFSFFRRCGIKLKHIFLDIIDKKSSYKYQRNYSKEILKEIISDYKPDIVHTNLGVIHVGYEICHELGIPHVWHLRDYHDLDFHWKPLPSWEVYRQQLKQSDAVVTITDDIRKHYRLWDSPNALTIYNGCFDAGDVALEFPKEKYFFCASRLIETKGHNDVVKAFDIFWQKHRDYQLILAGIGDEQYITQLKELISCMSCCNSIKFIGHQHDIRPWMQKARALIVASYNEGFGRMTAEAAFCGCLVIGRNTGGTKEILEQTGGFLFDDKTAVEKMAERMTQVVNLSDTDYREMAEKAQRVAINLYSNEAYVEQVFALYQRLLERKTKHGSF